MITTKKRFIIFTSAFVIMELLLSTLIQLATNHTASSLLSLASISLAFIYVILIYRKTRRNALMIIALLATLIADFFLTTLVEFENKKVVAMCFFNVTQFCYFLIIYFNHTQKAVKITHILVRLGVALFAIILSIIVLKENSNALSIISIFYFANLTVNLVFAFMQAKISLTLPIGLVFFITCDVIIGLNEISTSFIPIPEGSILYSLINSGINLAWVFYVPSQTLLAISTNEALIKSFKKEEF